MIEAQELIEMMKGKEKNSFRLGTIINGKVQFDGEDTPSQKTYKRLGSYTITDGDRVLLARLSGSYIILGKVI